MSEILLKIVLFVKNPRVQVQIQVFKNFKTYLVGATVIAYVPILAVKDIFTQQEAMGRRCRWINKIQEFNIDIQITKLVRGQRLAKLMVEVNLDANQINLEDDCKRSYIFDIQCCDWYKDVVYYSQRMQCLEGLTENEKRTLKLHAIKYVIIRGKLWWRNLEGVLLKCVDETKASELLK